MNKSSRGAGVFSLRVVLSLNRFHKLMLAASFACLSIPVFSQAKPAQDALKAGFEHPPQSARPRVWWHWMNGNISKEGIKLDLEWMHRVGLAGYQNFDAALQTPQVVD